MLVLILFTPLSLPLISETIILEVLPLFAFVLEHWHGYQHHFIHVLSSRLFM